MNIKIVAAGKLKKDYIRAGADDFIKRLLKYINLEIIEVKDEKDEGNPPKIIKQREGLRMLNHISEGTFLICLDIQGKGLSTEEFAGFLEQKKLESTKEITFVIGGSNGLSDEILKKANFKLSFSKMTFPHSLMRLILLEQIYRAEKLLKGEPYHK